MSKYIKEDLEKMLREHTKNQAKLTEVELKKEGYEFTTEWVKKKNRFGEDVSFKKYYLEDMVVQNMSHIPRLD